MASANTSDENGQEALGRALRGLRQRSGITQEELGVRIGIDPTYISRVEGGRINLRWATLQRFLQALDAAISDLAAEIERPDQPRI
jgi:transcriptional regulator with XRE-family HTH domain